MCIYSSVSCWLSVTKLPSFDVVLLLFHLLLKYSFVDNITASFKHKITLFSSVTFMRSHTTCINMEKVGLSFCIMISLIRMFSQLLVATRWHSGNDVKSTCPTLSFYMLRCWTGKDLRDPFASFNSFNRRYSGIFCWLGESTQCSTYPFSVTSDFLAASLVAHMEWADKAARPSFLAGSSGTFHFFFFITL